jgi:hypothetical protein
MSNDECGMKLKDPSLIAVGSNFVIPAAKCILYIG